VDFAGAFAWTFAGAFPMGFVFGFGAAFVRAAEVDFGVGFVVVGRGATPRWANAVGPGSALTIDANTPAVMKTLVRRLVGFRAGT
jgi:hypothetical protein